MLDLAEVDDQASDGVPRGTGVARSAGRPAPCIWSQVPVTVTVWWAGSRGPSSAGQAIAWGPGKTLRPRAFSTSTGISLQAPSSGVTGLPDGVAPCAGPQARPLRLCRLTW